MEMSIKNCQSKQNVLTGRVEGLKKLRKLDLACGRFPLENGLSESW